MQSTGHTGGRHFPHPEQSSGMMITSSPWLKMAPNWGGQWRRQVSQLMHSDISIRKGACFHFGLRSRSARRSTRLAPLMGRWYSQGSILLDPAVKACWHLQTVKPPRENGAETDIERRLTRQGQERKQQLLDHAAELFAERGFSETRVIDIVRSAGVAKGLFYWYFENKEAVFRELVESTRRRMRSEQRAAIDPAAHPLLRIRQGTEASIRFMGEHRRLYSIIDLESLNPALTTLLRAGGDIHAQDTARHVRAGIEQGLIRDDDPLMLAWGVVGTVSSFSHLHRTGRLDQTIDELATFAGRFVVRALASSDDVAARVEAGTLQLAGA